MCKHCDDDWKLSGVAKRDFQHSKDGPEELPHRPKNKKSNNKRWCKGKEGREHRWKYVVVREWPRKIYGTEDYVIEQERRWVCQGCGKILWGNPAPVVPEHKHCFCDTKIRRLWRREEIFEACCVCGRRGKSYSYYVGL